MSSTFTTGQTRVPFPPLSYLRGGVTFLAVGVIPVLCNPREEKERRSSTSSKPLWLVLLQLLLFTHFCIFGTSPAVQDRLSDLPCRLRRRTKVSLVTKNLALLCPFRKGGKLVSSSRAARAQQHELIMGVERRYQSQKIEIATTQCFGLYHIQMLLTASHATSTSTTTAAAAARHIYSRSSFQRRYKSIFYR